MRARFAFCLIFLFSNQTFAQKVSPCSSSPAAIATLTDVIQNAFQKAKASDECKLSGARLDNIDQLHHTVDEIVVKLLMKEQCLNDG